MHPSAGTYVFAVANLLLELIVCLYAFRRRLYLRLPLFTAYLALLSVRNSVLWWFYLRFGYDSRASFDYFWMTQCILLAARGAAIGEIAWRSLHRYRGIWALSSLLLAGIALVLIVHAWLAALANRSWIAVFVLTTERGLELVAVVLLVALFSISRHYGIPIAPRERMVALGLGSIPRSR